MRLVMGREERPGILFHQLVAEVSGTHSRNDGSFP